MKAKLIVLCVLSVCLSVTVYAQSYEKLWKDVKAMEKLDRPKSVIELTQVIYKKAQRERNVPEMMKAYVTGMDYRESITPDSVVRDIEGLERWLNETKEPLDAAVLHSILAEMYSSYFMFRSGAIMQAKATGETSADMTEWSGNTFVAKIFEHLRYSIKDIRLLADTKVDAFKPIVEKGETSEYFRHDMFHLLGQRAIAVLSPLKWRANQFYAQLKPEPAVAFETTDGFLTMEIPQASDYDCVSEMFRIYQSMLRYYTSAGNLAASALVDMNRLGMAYENTERDFREDKKNYGQLIKTPYYVAITDLTARYASVDVCAEVYKKMADYVLQFGYPAEALKISREALSKYPSYNRINMFRELETSILLPRLRGQADQTAYPGTTFDLRLNYCNLTGVTVNLYKVNLPATSDLLEDIEVGETISRSKYARLSGSEHFDVNPTPDYLTADTLLKVKAPGEGVWMIEIVPDVKVQNNVQRILYVSKLKVINRMLPGGESEFVVVDAQSGHPVSQAEVLLYERTDDMMKQVKVLVTDDIGTAQVRITDTFNAYRAQKGTDTGIPFVNIWYMPYRSNPVVNRNNDLNLFTDRSIYRPGQTVYVAGIAYDMDGDSVQVRVNAGYKIGLYDANRKMIAEKEVRTNEFGSFAGEFQLLSPCLPGRFNLRAGNAQVSFLVDEYKRPTFDVTFDPVKVAYSVGDSVWVSGVAKTFSGVPVQSAEVKYSVKTALPYWVARDGGVSIMTGSTLTNSKGEFRIRVFLKPANNDRAYIYYNYVVNAAVTNGAGETQSGKLNIPSGKNPLVLTCNIPGKLRKESSDSLTVYVRNLNGEPEPIGGTIEIYKLQVADNGLSSVTGSPVLQETFVPNKAFKPVSVLNLPSGRYRMVLTIKNGAEGVISQQYDFVLYSVDDKKPPYPTASWFEVVKNEFAPGSPASLLFGTSEKDVYVLYDVFAGDKCLESKRIMLTDSVVKMVYPNRAEYGDGLFVQFAFVKGGKLYEESAVVVKAAPDKKLTLKWETFRDKLRPGQLEEWKLRILTPDGKPADAELLATLYDASLDKLSEHNWFFNLYFPRPVERFRWKGGYPVQSLFSADFLAKVWKYKGLVYDRFTIGFLIYSREEDFSPVGGDLNQNVVGAEGVKSRVNAKAPASVQQMEYSVSADESGKMDTAEAPSAPGVQVRENFSETAFFYPQLRTNANGEVSLSFTLPESLTRWKFLGLSHTRNMDWGKTEAITTASKDFMIAPNMPRFVRTGDVVSIAANIMNLTGKDIAGTVKMELFTPETEKVFLQQNQNFRVKAGETGTVSFSFTVGKDYPQLLACRMVAEGGNFSDGEQRLIPVLSNKQQITESIPMAINGKETREFSLAGLFNHNSKTATDRRLTVEFTSNPAWYAIQALPSLSTPANDNAISWASAYYANSVASYIATSTPRIKAIFDSWKQQGGTKETLLSNLQKNQELKNILLEETPWVMEASNEAEQKQRIAVLFDLNTIQYNNTIAVDKLRTLQQNGMWSWYKGMSPSPYVTLFVAEALGRLPVLTGKPLPPDARQLQDGTWQYLHKEALDIYKSMLKAEKAGAKNQSLSDFTLKYLYLTAITGQEIPQANKEAHAYFVNRAARTLIEQNLYQKALSAVILHYAGHTGEAANFIASLREYAVQTPDMGIYYDSKAAPYSADSYRIPTQVAILEAMQLVARDMDTVGKMKIWLLKQKQTQSWDSPVATVNAIYALINRGTDLLTGGGDTRITIGKQVIENSFSGQPQVSGLNYVKKTFTGNEIKPDMKSITVQKRDSGIAWGAVYAQYLEETGQVTATERDGVLSVDKKLYVERMKDNRPLLVSLKEAGSLTPGDKIISRITIKTQRDMDFIQLKDERAACLEPLTSLSGYQYQNNMGYYVAVKDASTEFFFDGLKKGSYILEFSYYVTRTGDYTGGIATLQSAYAPEFTAHTASEQVKVTQ